MNTLSNTWIFETRTNEADYLLVAVHASYQGVEACARASKLLTLEGFTSAKSDGNFGFSTHAKLAYQELAPEGIITAGQYVSLLEQANIQRHGHGMSLNEKALLLAKALHLGQRRKDGGDYFSLHLFPVAELVKKSSGDDVAIAAAYLHDAIEDQPERNPLEQIENVCGWEVLSVVLECTEDGTGISGKPKPPWKQRKDSYLAHIPSLSQRALLVALHDKLQSLTGTLTGGGGLLGEIAEKGDEAYAIFKTGKEGCLWFHHELTKRFTERAHALGVYEDLTQEFAVQVARMK